MWVFLSLWIGLSLIYFFSYCNRGFDTNIGMIIITVILGLIVGGIAAIITAKVFDLWPFDEDVKSDQGRIGETDLQGFSSHEERENLERLARKVYSQTDDGEVKEVCEKLISLAQYSRHVEDRESKNDAVRSTDQITY